MCVFVAIQLSCDLCACDWTACEEVVCFCYACSDVNGCQWRLSALIPHIMYRSYSTALYSTVITLHRHNHNQMSMFWVCWKITYLYCLLKALSLTSNSVANSLTSWLLICTFAFYLMFFSPMCWCNLMKIANKSKLHDIFNRLYLHIDRNPVFSNLLHIQLIILRYKCWQIYSLSAWLWTLAITKNNISEKKTTMLVIKLIQINASTEFQYKNLTTIYGLLTVWWCLI